MDTYPMVRLLGVAPFLLVYGTGVILSFVYWRRCPSACLLALIGCLLNAGMTMTGEFMLTSLLREQTEDVHTRLQALQLISSAVHAVGWMLIVAAVFTGRRDRELESAFE